MNSSPILYQSKLNYSGSAWEMGGHCEKIFATDEEGKKVMIKSNNDIECVIAEWFCAWLAERLGLKTNKVNIIDKGQEYKLSKYCSVHYWMDDFRTSGSIRGTIEYEKIKDLPKNYQQYKAMKFFDKIIHNGDRHDSNYGYDKENDIVVIDHEICFPWNRWERYDTEYIKDYFNENTVRENSPLDILIKNLLSITEQELVYLLMQLPYEFYGYAKNIIRRIVKIQKAVKKYYKVNKSAQVAA